jgi:hypothetical protein
MLDLSDEDLLLRLRNFEDHLTERKSVSDAKDWLKTAVAFANSTPVGYPAVLFIGVSDKGTPDLKQANLEQVQKTFTDKLARAYPPINCCPRVLTVAGQQILAVIIPGSPDRPHFSGPSYIRVGARTREASEAEFNRLVAMRGSKVYEILKWQHKEVTFVHRYFWDPIYGTTAENQRMRAHERIAALLLDATPFYLTVREVGEKERLLSAPLDRVTLDFDHSHSRLLLEHREPGL